MDNFININSVATFTGMIALITLLVQVIKHFVTASIDPKWYVLGLSLLLNVARQMFILKDWNGESIFMMIINVLIIAGAAIGLFEGAVKPIVNAKKKDDSSE